MGLDIFPLWQQAAMALNLPAKPKFFADFEAQPHSAHMLQCDSQQKGRPSTPPYIYGLIARRPALQGRHLD